MSQFKSLRNKKVAILIANGFNEKTLTAVQRSLMNAGANLKIVSSESGLVSGWNVDNWGHHFAVDKNIEEALGTDYDVLLMPGGKRSVDKLNVNPHTKRFVNSFLASKKPVIAFDNALRILAETDNIAGRTVAGPDEIKDDIMRSGVHWADEPVNVDDNILTGVCSNDEERNIFIKKMKSFFENTLPSDNGTKMAA